MEGIFEKPSYMVPRFARGLTVLLVDSDTTSLMLLASMLEQYSYKVTTTESATVALSMVREHQDRFRLVIANIKTPDMDSITFQFTMLNRNIPLIFMSCNQKLGAALRSVADGACFYYEKSISFDDLKYVWQHVFRKKPTPFKLKTIQADAADYRETGVNSMGRPEAHGINIRQPVVPGGSNDLSGTNPPQQQRTIDPRGKKKLFEPIEVILIDDDSSEEFSETAWIESMMRPSESQKKTGSSGTKRSNEDADHSKGKEKKILKMRSENSNSAGNKRSAEDECTSSSTCKRPRAVWNHEMHLKFTAAISALGNKNARPKSILRKMGVPGLTHRQVASHLQKYRTQVQRISETCATSLLSAVMNKPSNILGGAGSSNILAGSLAQMPGIQNSIFSQLGNRSFNSLTAGISGEHQIQSAPPHEVNVRELSLTEKKTAPLASIKKNGSKKSTERKPQGSESSKGKFNSGKMFNGGDIEAKIRDWNRRVYSTSSTSVAPPASLETSTSLTPAAFDADPFSGKLRDWNQKVYSTPSSSLAPPPIWAPSSSLAPPPIWAPSTSFASSPFWAASTSLAPSSICALSISLTPPAGSESQNQPLIEYNNIMKLLDDESEESNGICGEPNQDELDRFCDWLLGEEENP